MEKKTRKQKKTKEKHQGSRKNYKTCLILSRTCRSKGHEQRETERKSLRKVSR